VHDLIGQRSLVANEVLAIPAAIADDLGGALAIYDPLARCQAFATAAAGQQQFGAFSHGACS
jgi:hypothetical protein